MRTTLLTAALIAALGTTLARAERHLPRAAERLDGPGAQAAEHSLVGEEGGAEAQDGDPELAARGRPPREDAAARGEAERGGR